MIATWGSISCTRTLCHVYCRGWTEHRFRATGFFAKNVCLSESINILTSYLFPLDLVHMWVVGVLLISSAVAFVLFMVYRKKTNAATSIPKFFKFAAKGMPESKGYLQEKIFVPEVVPCSPTLMDEEKDVTSFINPCDDSVLRMRCGVSAEADKGLSDSVEVATDEGSGYTQGRDLEPDEPLEVAEAPSGYEKRAGVVS